jgi:glycosyltransferase involved in cell wall biosynthesis
MTLTAENADLQGLSTSTTTREIRVTLLTGGGDRHYVFGLATALMSKGAGLDLIGSDDLDGPEFRGKPGLNFVNLRGNQRPDVSFPRKVSRVLVYYIKLIRYAATAKPAIFHILWNNKFQSFDRTLLMLYYRLLGKKIVLTVHNVNAGKRDSNDTWLNRLTLGMQYRLASHLFVHTKKMRREVIEEFGVPENRTTVIPYGINNAVPNTHLVPSDAKLRLGIREGERTILFFGNIAPYKGLKYLVAAFQHVLARCDAYRLIIAGPPKNCEGYWSTIQQAIGEVQPGGRVLLRAEFIPDEETELYFKAADVLVLPYTQIYQSGVLFLGYSFGLPVIASDVGSLREDIVEGKTGYVFKRRDHLDLARNIERYFASDLYGDLNNRRQEICDYATERHSWDVVGEVTRDVYGRLLGRMDSVTSGIDSHSCVQRAGTDR